MLATLRHPGVLVAVVLWSTVGSLFAVFSSPCRADIAPESGLLAHVQPVSGSGGRPSTHGSQVIRSAGADDKADYPPPVRKGVEEALEFLADDELLEVTPQSLRLRKRMLKETDRRKALRKRKREAQQS